MIRFIVAFTMLLMLAVPVRADERTGRIMYDLGVFDYEAGDYEKAKTNAQKALEADPQNPRYHHLMGGICLKTGRFSDAIAHLSKAYETDPSIAGLKYDLAYCHCKMSDFEKSASMFAEILRDEPSNVLARYYAGISRFNLKQYEAALPRFIDAAEMSPTMTANARYYAGVCYARTGRTGKAAEMFEYVKENAEPGPMRKNAAQWLEALEMDKKPEKPWWVFLRVSFKHDDNAGLFPPDRDAYEETTDEEDNVIAAFVSGRYDFLESDGLTLGAGYSHYQSWYSDWDKYNLTASMPHVYLKYTSRPFTYSLEYMPSFYRVDSETFLKSHRIKPGIAWKSDRGIELGASCRFTDNDYDNDERDGNAGGLFANARYPIAGGKIRLSAETGFEIVSASYDIYAHKLWTLNAGLSANLPLKLRLGLSARFAGRDYDETDPDYQTKREDTDCAFSASVSRNLFFDWLELEAMYEYSENDSNISDFDYERNVAAFSITANY